MIDCTVNRKLLYTETRIQKISDLVVVPNLRLLLWLGLIMSNTKKDLALPYVLHFQLLLSGNKYPEWSFSQTKVKVDNNPKSRPWSTPSKYLLRIQFFCRIPVMNWEIFLHCQEFDKNCFNSKYVLKNTLYKHYL